MNMEIALSYTKRSVIMLGVRFTDRDNKIGL